MEITILAPHNYINMKKHLLTIACVLFAYCAKAQITLEHTFNPTNNASAILFSSNGTKLMANDTGNNTIKLYNTDYSLWKSIPMPIPAGNKPYVVLYVSDRLFNNDDNVEAYVSWWNTSSLPFVYHSVVINETGSIIKDFGEGAYAYLYYISGTYKLFVTRQNYFMDVYALPGELPCGHCGLMGVPRTAQGGNSPVVFPNPAGEGTITIQHGLPANISGMLIISADDGRQLGSWPVSGQQPQAKIDISSYVPGHYIVTILGQGLEPAYGSFVK